MISLLNFVIIASCLTVTHGGMDCSWLQKNDFLSRVTNTNSCPGVLDNSSKSYCCINTNGEVFCCTFVEFAQTYLIIGAVVLLIILIVAFLLCCFFCSCCAGCLCC